MKHSMLATVLVLSTCFLAVAPSQSKEAAIPVTYDNDGDMTLTIPESGVYQSVMIFDTDGYTPFFFAEPGQINRQR